MINIIELEKQYLDGKIAYYEGRQIMEDVEFDFIERLLRENGSKVVEQVGSKRKDFNYSHPTKMLSLAKIQTEEGNNMKNEFNGWFAKRQNILYAKEHNNKYVLDYIDVTPPQKLMYSSAKFDGNAINIIHCFYKLY